MAQTPHQQIQVVQQQPVSSSQLQQLYFPHQQMMFPGNLTLQQAGPGQQTLQSIAPNRSYSAQVLPKPIQSSAIPMHSISGNQRQIATAPQTTGTFQPDFLGSFATLAPLPVGYQWANCYQQNPIIIRSQHPNIYVQQPQPHTAIQLPISAAQQIVTPTSYTSNPQIQLETQTIATQTLVPSVTAVNSSNAYIQLDPNIPSAAKPSPSASPTSSSEVSNMQVQSQTNPPMLVSTQSMTHHILDETSGILTAVTETTEIQSTEVQSELGTPEKELIPSPHKSTMAEPSVKTVSASTETSMTVSSTTPTSSASISQLHSFVSSVGKRTVSMATSPPRDKGAPGNDNGGSSDDKGESVTSVVQEQVDPVMTEHFSPQNPIKNPYLGPLQRFALDKQPQKAIVKPQMVNTLVDSCVGQEDREAFLESLKSMADSPKLIPQEEPDSALIQNIMEDAPSPVKKPKVTRGRGRPRGRPPSRHKHKHTAGRRRSLRQQSQIEILEVIERNASGVSESSDSHPATETSPSALPEILSKPGPSTSMSASSIAADVAAVIEQKLDVNMPKTPPDTWSVDEVFEFIQGFPGCYNYAESFKSQEIDGQALLLIKLDHLMTGMAMKLGPAVKLIAHIRSMNEHLS